MPRKPSSRLPEPIPQRFHTNQLWVAHHRFGHSEIMAYSEVSKQFENVLDVRGISGHTAKTMAEFVLNIVNVTILNEGLMLNAMRTMQELLNDNDFNAKTEKTVTDLVKRISQAYVIAQRQNDNS